MARGDKAAAGTPSRRRPRETNPDVLRQALVRMLPYRTGGQGRLSFPAVPALLDHYLRNCRNLFTCLGRSVSDAEASALRSILAARLEEGFGASTRASVVLTYETHEPPGNSLSYELTVEVKSVGDAYADWQRNRTTPLFGVQPDAKVMNTARQLGPGAAVLDVGAGTGRNLHALAAAGFAADAVELAPALAAVLREECLRAGRSTRIFEGDVCDPALDLPRDHYGLVFLSEVVATHTRNVADLTSILGRTSELVRPGGFLLFNMFVCLDGYKPDDVAREMAAVYWCPVFTHRELDFAMGHLPLDRVSEEPAFEYEREHQPAETWPPTEWFEGWATGRDLFDLPETRVPVELRWFVYRKR